MKKTPLACFVCLLLAVGSPLAIADDTDDSNILVIVRVGHSDAGAPKVYQTVVRASNSPVRLMAGHRIPVPVTTFQTPTPPTGEIIPITSYTYQNVGFEAQFNAYVTPEGKISITGNIEDSRVSGTTDRGQPVIAATQSSFKAKLTQGEPLQILIASDGDAGSISYELEAEVID